MVITFIGTVRLEIVICASVRSSMRKASPIFGRVSKVASKRAARKRDETIGCRATGHKREPLGADVRL